MYIKDNNFSSNSVGNTVSVHHSQQFYSHTPKATLCQYIRDNILIHIHCWLHCFNITRTTHCGNNVQVYQRQELNPQKRFASLCQYIRGNKFILTTVGYNVSIYQWRLIYSQTMLSALCQYIRNKTFLLTHFWLQFFSIWETTILFSLTFGYTLSLYQRQQYIPQTLVIKILLAARCKYIRDNDFFLTHC